jgi:hypothetical protein
MITLPRAVADYLSEFHLAAIYISSGGKIGVATPARLSRLGPVVVWWVRDRATAEQILTAIGTRHPMSAEGAARAVHAAADRLGVVLSEHSDVMQRAKLATAKIDERLAAAQDAATAHAGLRKAIAATAATDSMPALMAAVFGETRVSPRVGQNQKNRTLPGQCEPIGSPPVHYLMRLGI